MDPTTNPTPTPNPAPAPGVPPVPPVPPVAPIAPATPTAPATPSVPVTPTIPEAPSIPTPVSPIINPTNPTGGVTNFSSSLNGVAATEPIMQPEPALAPDPVEQELKEPMKAAAPVPGSIGSAVSGPEAQAEATVAPEPAPATNNPFVAESASSTPSVSFNDPATQQDVSQVADNVKPAKKSSRTTLIALVIVAFMVVIALAAVLIMQLVGPNGANNQNNNSNPNSAEESKNPINRDDSEDNDDDNANNNSNSDDSNNNNTNNNSTSNNSGSKAVVCVASQAGTLPDGEEYSVSVEMRLNFINNKLIDANITTESTMDGKTTVDTETTKFEDIVGSGNGFGDEAKELISEDGVLKVSIEEFKNYAETELKAEAEISSCTIE